MIIKHADDKSKRIALLEELQNSSHLDRRQKEWLADELMRTMRGIQGERDAAHYLDTHFRDAKNHVVLHDLRISIDGEVAQIDHVIINRGFTFYLLETKNYSGDLLINERGEFSVTYGRSTFGIPSPLEQSRRHEQVLARLLDRLAITGRTQARPDFQHVVLVAPKATIRRPKASAFDSGNVIKADQFQTWRANFVEKQGFGSVLGLALNLRSLDTIREWGEMLSRQHRPADLLALPEFMKPRMPHTAVPPEVPPSSRSPSTLAASDSSSQRRLICATCNSKISYAEGKYCWNNQGRFGGLQYCRQHQAAFH